MRAIKIKKSKIISLALLLGLGFLFLASGSAVAQDTFGLQPIGGNVGLAGGDIRLVVTNIIRIALGLLGIIAVAIVLYGGFVYMTSNGEEEKIATAKKIIINGAIGLAIILSAFAITQFIFQKLSAATGSGNVPEIVDVPPGLCDKSNPAYDAAKCSFVCETNPLLSTCEEQHFYVKSITPSTPDENDAVKMNNIKFRVIFSRKLAGNAAIAGALSLRSLDTGLELPLVIQLGGEGKILEAEIDSATKLAPNDFNRGYEIKVNSDLKDELNGDLETKINGKDYPLDAIFKVNTDGFVDNVKPFINPITILNSNNQATKILYVGETFSIASILKDRNNVEYGGNSLLHVSILDSTPPNTVLMDYYNGPEVKVGSSADYLISYNGIVSPGIFQPLHNYTVRVRGWDIDNNLSVASVTFTVFGKDCHDGIKNGDETDVDSGGSCGSTGSCSFTSPCADGLLCVEGQCKAHPTIKEVVPMNGAPGNWITIYGSNFGKNKIGKVDFASKKSDGTYGPWVSANVVSCEDEKSWHNDWVVVEVPTGKYFNGALEIGSAKEGHVEIAATSSLDIKDKITLEAWVKTADNGAFKTIISKKGSYYLTLNQLKPSVYLSGTANVGWHIASTAIPANTWTHLAATYDGSKVNFFINGKKDSNAPLTSGVIASEPGKDLWLGNREDMAQYRLTGQIDEVAIYNSVLNDQNVLDHYNAKNDNFAYENAVLKQNPVGFWRLAETSGLAVSDSSANKVVGSYVGEVKLGQEGIFGSVLTNISEQNQIRLTSGDEPTLFDTTVDDFGPKPLPPFNSELEKSNYLLKYDPGLFIVNGIKRPGLCKVSVSEDTTLQVGGILAKFVKGSIFAPPQTPLLATGAGFGDVQGTSNIKFSVKDAKGKLLPGFLGEIKSAQDWGDKQIFTVAPLNIIGDTAVYTTVQNEQSNSVKFTIISDKDFTVLPQISAIDPVSTTPKSMITISGTGFGSDVGQIFVADTAQHVLNCDSVNKDASCQQLDVTFPNNQCGKTWTDTQVIAQVPADAKMGKFFLALQKGDVTKLKTNGLDKFEVKAGDPRPGICLLDPSQGPAPLPVGSEGLKIFGQNFSAAPLVFFQSAKAKINDLSTWLVSTNSDIISKNDNKIQTLIPIDKSAGSSMVTGFIKVKSDKGEVSNGVKYTVQDCTKSGEVSGLKCCQTGPDAGQWKPENYVCAGEAREAGFVWRFASGIITDFPHVVEQCDELNWSDAGKLTTYPSPVPWENWQKGKNACVNSSIVVRFNLPMKAGTFTGDNVKVYKCADKDGKIDCADKADNELKNLDFKVQFGAEAETVLIIGDDAIADLEKNTWYHVELSDKILSYEKKNVLGQVTYLEQPLQKTKPCGKNTAGLETAYCFDFKTSAATCKLTGATINPPNYSVNYLGTLFDPQFPPAANDDPYNIANPLYYFVWGKGEQECSVLDVDGLGWKWDADPGQAVAANKKAKAFVAPSETIGAVYKDSRATVDAMQNTYPDNVLVKAQTTIGLNPGLTDNIGGVDILKLAGKDKGYKQENLQTINIDSTAAANSIVNLPSSFTLEIKYKLDDLQNFVSEVIGKKDAYSLMYYSGDGKNSGLCFGAPIFSETSSICVHDFDAKKAPVIGDTYHYIYVYDNITKKIKLYGDGKLISEKDFGNIPQNAEPLILGGSDATPAGVTFEVLRMRPGTLADATIVGILTGGTGADASLINATGNLMIDLGDPQVTYYEPDCIESCINPSIKAVFSRQMDKNSYVGNYEVYKCQDSNCADTKLQPGLFKIDDSSDTNNLVLTLVGSNVLATSSYYKVVLTDKITSIGGIIPAVGEGEPTILPGKPLKPFAWFFKTQSNSTPCSANYLKLTPGSIKASTIGAKNTIKATPYSSPNNCSKYGQTLDKWKFGYSWTTDDNKVATVTNFTSANGWKSYCTESCLPVGSNIKNDIADPVAICGNTIVEAGEDCDIMAANESTGVSCTLNCLRPGNNKKVSNAVEAQEAGRCGNGVVEKSVGEQCDPGSSKITNKTNDTDIYCSDSCLFQGSLLSTSGEKSTQAEANDPNAPKPSICGDKEIGKGEACEIKEAGCSDKCLHEGSILASNWCETVATSDQKKTTQCVGAVSVCGNSVVENGEECEAGMNGVLPIYCDSSCLLKDLCKTPLKQCDASDEGCNSDCTLAGSSVLYKTSSLCGDGMVGVGEYAICENTSPQVGSVAGSNPVQMITAVGEKIILGTTQTTTIRSEHFNNKIVKGSSEYALQCGYTEFDLPVTINTDGNDHVIYNDCPENSVGNFDNALGVGKNSCCLPRSKRVSEYPIDGAGFFGNPGVCRNTFVSVEFPTEISLDSVNKNIQLVHGYTDPAHICAAGTDFSAVINNLLAVAEPGAEQTNWWNKLWNGLKHFFAGIFGTTANASKMTANDVRDNTDGKKISVWCGSEVSFIPDVKYAKNGNEATTTIGIYLNNVLQKDDVYGVVLKGGKAGIADKKGVGIKSPDYALSPDDVWFFHTGSDICKLKSIQVEPSGYLFNHPFATSSFVAKTESIEGQQIIPTPAYEWVWHWGPINQIFDVPLIGTPANKDAVIIGVKNVEGKITGVVQAQVTKDISVEGENHQGKSFNALIDLVAMFCANPWPGYQADGSWKPYQDDKFNFSLSYCADAGASLTKEDDLPYLKDPLYFLPNDDSVVKKCTLENKTCKLEADCDPTLYKIPGAATFNVPAGSGLCWDSAKDASYNNISCSKISDCFVGKDLPLNSSYEKIIVKGGLGYVTMGEHVIGIYDVSNSNDIKLLGNYQNLDGVITDLQIENNNAYFVSYPNGGLQIVDVSDPSQPKLVKKVNFYQVLDAIKTNPKNYKDYGAYERVEVYTPKGNVILNITGHLDAEIKLVHNYNQGGNGLPEFPPISNYSLADDAGQLWIMDISDPNSPQKLAQVADTNLKITNVLVEGTKAYIVLSGSNAVKPTIYVVDISNVVHPAVLSSMPLPTDSPTENISSLALGNGKLVAGSDLGRVYVATLSDAGSPQLSGTVILPKGVISSTVKSIEIIGTYAVLGLNGFNAGVSIIDLAAAQPAAAPFGSYGPGANFAQNGKNLFISNGVKVDGLEFKDSPTPQIIKSYAVPAGAMYASGNNLFYLINQIDNKKLSVINLLSDPSLLTCKTQFDASWKNSCKSSFQFVTPEILSGDTIKRLVFFNDTNEDAVGLQIFLNEDGKSLDEWYTGHKFDLAGMQKTTIAGYEALTDGSNYYINGLNYVEGTANNGIVYHNIYLFSVNPTAQEDTLAVVKQMMESLKYNTNMTDHNMCLVADTLATVNTIRQNSDNITTNNKCTNDFDCRNENGDPILGTNGVCSNVKTKFFRDLLSRLPAISSAQTKITSYIGANKNLPSFKGDLKGGTYIPGYTVSKWPSWGVLGGLVTGLPMDPINRWTKCDADDQQTCWKAASSTYSCPNFKSVYEYEFVSSTKDYVFHAPLEFFNLDDNIAKDYIDEQRFSSEPWCAGNSISPFDESCGNGIVGPNEQCDPPGQVQSGAEGLLAAKYGECQNWPGTKCVDSLVDCGYAQSVDNGKIIAHFFKQGICAVNKVPDGGTIAIDLPLVDNDKSILTTSPQHQIVFGCDTDDECKTATNYGSSNVREGYVAQGKVYTPAEFEDYLGINSANFKCLHYPATAVQCLGYTGAYKGACINGNQAKKVCNNSCKWDFGICKSAYKCSNGIVEGVVGQGGEACDDGALNGTYGHCNDSCSGLFDSYCGDGKKDQSTPSKEFCDWSVAPWGQEASAVGQSKYYGKLKENSCAWDCKGYGAYCGDGITQTVQGEECDDNNLKNGDGCSKECKNENIACINEKPQYHYINNNQDTLIYLTKFDDDVFKYLNNPGAVPIPFSPGIAQIAQCFDKTTGEEICNAVGFACKNVIENRKCLESDKKLPTINLDCMLGSSLANWTDISLGCNVDLSSKLNNLPADHTYAVNCAGKYVPPTPAVPPAPLSNVIGCGSGIIDTDQTDPAKNEVCDKGSQNGIKCVPEYGKSCNYCSSDCKKVLTVDAKEYCGDGTVNGPEKCDKKDGVVYGADTPQGKNAYCVTTQTACKSNCYQANPTSCYNACDQAYTQCLKTDHFVALSCADKGAYECSANCQVLEGNKCVACKDAVGKPIPYARFINPMLGQAGYSQAVSIFYYTFFRDISGSWYHFNKSGAGDYSFNNKINTLYKGGLPLINLAEANSGVESDQLCKNEYKLAFNAEQIKSAKNEDDNGLVTKGYLDTFDYDVNNESKEIFNNLIYSPAVPKNVFRVVIKWGEDEITKNGTFVGTLYNDIIASKSSTDPQGKSEAVLSYIDYAANNVPVVDGQGTVTGYINNLCSGVEKQNVFGAEYYWPSAFFNTDGSVTSLCKFNFNGYGYDGIYVHPIVTIGKTTVQSFTINLNGHDGDFAFLVQSMNNLLSTYKDGELTVEVYGYHPEQLPLYSIYQPIATFKIKDIPEENLNPLVKYWHVFNFVKKFGSATDYEIKKIPVTDAGGNTKDNQGNSLGEYDNGWLNTGFCQVLNQMPNVPSGNKCAI